MPLNAVLLSDSDPLFKSSNPDIDFVTVKNIFEFRRAVKNSRIDAIICEIGSNNWQSDLDEVVTFIRNDLADDTVPIILLNRLTENLFESTIMSKFDIFALYNCAEDDSQYILQSIEQKLRPLIAVKQKLEFGQKQTQLLTSVNQFSHYRQPLAELINDFSASLHKYTYANLSLKVLMNNEKVSKLESLGDDTSFNDKTIKQIQQLVEPDVAKAVIQKSPQVELTVPEAIADLFVSLNKAKPSCLLSFPVVVYNHVICVVICFIPYEKMRFISVSSINIIKEASLHLKVLLERRSAENRLKAQYQRLKASLNELQTTKEHLIHNEKLASIGEFAAGIAHEINNPLAYVLSNFTPLDNYVGTLLNTLKIHDEIIEQIEEKTRPQISEYREALKLLHKETEIEYIVEDIQAIVNDSREGILRVRDIISDLSSFSRKQELETCEFNVKKLIEETLRILGYELRNKVQVKVLVADDIMIDAHRGFFQQILTNLIKNACQAVSSVQHAQSQPEIEIIHEMADGKFNLKIQDNGPGIPAGNISKIFEPFFTTKEVGKGTGLGLSVTYNLAKKMGGDLSVTSELNKFTCFVISLPINLKNA